MTDIFFCRNFWRTTLGSPRYFDAVCKSCLPGENKYLYNDDNDNDDHDNDDETIYHNSYIYTLAHDLKIYNEHNMSIQ